MQIALLHYSAPPVVGGVEAVLAQQTQVLTQAGHQVSVLAGRGQIWSKYVALRRLPLLDSRATQVLALKRELDAGHVPPGFAQVRATLADQLRTALAGVQIVIAHNVCSLHKNLPLTAALHQLNGAPGFPRLIAWHHDLAWTTPRYAAELHPGYPWDLLRTTWPKVTHVTISVARQQELAALFNLPLNTITVVPNGIDLATFYKLEAQTRDLLRRLPLAHAAPLLLLPVRLTPRKNIALALRVLAELRNFWPQAQLLVTGPEGPHNPTNAQYKADLLALRAELGLTQAAHFMAEHTATFLPDAVIADFFRMADALLLPSQEEGFGIPILEAALARLPIFCSDLPPLRALAGDHATYFDPAADPARVAELIRQRLGAEAGYQLAQQVRQTFAWEQVYARHIAPLLETAP